MKIKIKVKLNSITVTPMIDIDDDTIECRCHTSGVSVSEIGELADKLKFMFPDYRISYVKCVKSIDRNDAFDYEISLYNAFKS